MKKKCLLAGLTAFALALAVALPVWATEPPAETEAPGKEAVEIHTVEDLQRMAEDPEGSYILMQDLDMTDVAWKSLDFRGSFDGNGHVIMNLTLGQPGDARPESVDGNKKTYETAYVGFFGALQDARVENLNLMGLRALVESDEPCFLGGIAGYINNSTVTGCSVSGILELRAHDRIFGVGGLAGYGCGFFDSCNVDVTLITVDTDSETRDEQFMGGIMATGYGNISNCQIRIDGYCSEFGYCHNGGLVGMLMQYPWGGWTSEIKDNHVEGKITFFECNTNRRAYCGALVGEYLTRSRLVRRNTTDFQRDERRVYDVELRPELCENPVYTETVVAANCDTYGSTTHTCSSCDYTYTDSYRLYDHIPGEWTLIKEPTVEETGLWQAFCPCGQEHTREEPQLPPPPTEPAPTEPETVPPEPEQPRDVAPNGVLFLAAGTVMLALAVVLIVIDRKKKQ